MLKYNIVFKVLIAYKNMEVYKEREYRNGKLHSTTYGIISGDEEEYAKDVSIEGISATIRYAAFNIYNNDEEFSYTNKQTTQLTCKRTGGAGEIIAKLKTGLNERELEELVKYVSTSPPSKEFIDLCLSMRSAAIANRTFNPRS